MSVKAISAVWDHSESSGTALLRLLAIADSADHDGTNAWPSQGTLATKTRLSRRTVQRKIGDLVTLGELAVVPGPTHIRWDRRPNGYEIRLPGMTGCRPVVSAGRQSVVDEASNDALRGVTVDAQPVLTHPEPEDLEKIFSEMRNNLRHGPKP